LNATFALFDNFRLISKINKATTITYAINDPTMLPAEDEEPEEDDDDDADADDGEKLKLPLKPLLRNGDASVDSKAIAAKPINARAILIVQS